MSSFQGLKGLDFVTVPLKEKATINSEKNFIGFASDLVNFSANIVTFDKTSDTLDIENSLAGSSFLTEHYLQHLFI